jgi:tetratricopeptide (TPR) repeat protein
MNARSDTVFAQAIASLQAGRLEEAERRFKVLLRDQPRHIAALNLLGVICMRQQRFGKAEKYIKMSIEAGSTSDATFYNHGIVLKALNRPADAVEEFSRSLSINPSAAETWNNRGTANNDLLRFEDAVADFNRAIALKPGYADAYSNKGNSLTALRQFEEAQSCFDAALTLNPNLAEGWTGRGSLMFEVNDYDAAEQAFDHALALNPMLATAWHGRGVLLSSRNRGDEALDCFARATEIAPEMAEAHFAEACCRLKFGDTEDGWKKYEWRWETKAQKRINRALDKPLWLGDRPIKDKTILLHSEQGLGDTIQFCRFVEFVADAGANVVLEVQPGLKALLSCLNGVGKIIGTGEPLPAFDYHCPLGSLPLALQIRPEQLRAGPYLSVPDARIDSWRRRLGETTGLRIGLAWAGNPRFRGDHNRSIGLARMLPIVKNIDAHFVSLQKELGQHDQALLNDSGVIDCGSSVDDFLDTAALMSCLDVIISSDTSIVHLAGALGRQVWTLLQYAADWRWLVDRSDNPWYSSARLFRQTAPNDWDGVIARVVGALQPAAMLDRKARNTAGDDGSRPGKSPS